MFIADTTRAAEVNAEAIEFDFPNWRVESEMGDRFVSEFDMDPATDIEGPSDADWDAFLEMTWTDPAERVA